LSTLYGAEQLSKEFYCLQLHRAFMETTTVTKTSDQILTCRSSLTL